MYDKGDISVPWETDELVNLSGGSWTGGSPFRKNVAPLVGRLLK